MRIKNVSAQVGALAVALVCVGNSANASELRFPATQGHWVAVPGSDQSFSFALNDSSVCRETVGNASSLAEFRYWETPIILAAPPSTFVLSQRIRNAVNVRSRGYSFDAAGVLFSTTGSKSNGTLVGTLSLAARGTQTLSTELRTVSGNAGCIDNYHVGWP